MRAAASTIFSMAVSRVFQAIFKDEGFPHYAVLFAAGMTSQLLWRKFGTKKSPALL